VDIDNVVSGLNTVGKINSGVENHNTCLNHFKTISIIKIIIEIIALPRMEL